MFNFDSERRYQHCSWLERRWRDRYLLPVIPLAVWSWLRGVWWEKVNHYPREYLSLYNCWSIRRGMADTHRNYYWTLEEMGILNELDDD